MRDLLDRILDRMCVVVHRVDAPGVAGAMMMRMPDAVDRRIAQVHVRRRHVDFCAHDMFAVDELAGLHAAKQRQRFCGRTITETGVLARLAEVAPVRRHLVGGLAVYVGMAGADQVFGHLVEAAEIIAGVVQVRIAGSVMPVEAEPFHRLDDGVDVFLLFLGRIGVVEAQVGTAAVVPRQSEIEADGFCMTDMEIAVRLGRESRHQRWQRPATGIGASSVAALGQIVFDDGAQEVRRQRRDRRCGGRCRIFRSGAHRGRE